MSDAIFDKDELVEECEGDMQALARWVEIFDRDYRDRMPRLQAAVQAGDCDAMMKEAHALKGGIATFFAKAAYDTAYRLELMGRNAEPAKAEATFQQLSSEIQSLRDELGKLVAS
jgi:two-component system sensor histidine kinase/response regulator